MSTVYRARHLQSNNIAAMKLLRPEFLSDDTLLERFRREALAAGQLQHPNVIEIRDFGEDDIYGFYMVMEMLSGLDLEDIIHYSPFPKTWLFPILEQVCAGLQALHNSDIVHRDLKPSNVFLVPGESYPTVKLVDLGIAKLLQTSPHYKSMTKPGVVLGTPSYVAPELLAVSDDITPQVDVYALGVIVYLLLVGRLPLWHETFLAMMTALMWEEPIPLGQIRPELAGTDLEQFVLLMLEKDTSKRPSSVSEVWEELQACLILFDDPLDAWIDSNPSSNGLHVPDWLAEHKPFLSTPNEKQVQNRVNQEMLNALGLEGHINLFELHGPAALPKPQSATTDSEKKAIPSKQPNTPTSTDKEPKIFDNRSDKQISKEQSQHALLAPFTPSPETISLIENIESQSQQALQALRGTAPASSKKLSIPKGPQSPFQTIETGDLPAFLIEPEENSEARDIAGSPIEPSLVSKLDSAVSQDSNRETLSNIELEANDSRQQVDTIDEKLPELPEDDLDTTPPTEEATEGFVFGSGQKPPLPFPEPESIQIVAKVKPKRLSRNQQTIPEPTPPPSSFMDLPRIETVTVDEEDASSNLAFESLEKVSTSTDTDTSDDLTAPNIELDKKDFVPNPLEQSKVISPDLENSETIRSMPVMSEEEAKKHIQNQQSLEEVSEIKPSWHEQDEWEEEVTNPNLESTVDMSPSVEEMMGFEEHTSPSIVVPAVDSNVQLQASSTPMSTKEDSSQHSLPKTPTSDTPVFTLPPLPPLFPEDGSSPSALRQALEDADEPTFPTDNALGSLLSNPNSRTISNDLEESSRTEPSISVGEVYSTPLVTKEPFPWKWLLWMLIFLGALSILVYWLTT